MIIFSGPALSETYRHQVIALGDRYRKFYRTLNNAKKSFNSIFNSICLRIIDSKKLFLKNYSFKEKFIQKNWQLFIQKIIHLEKNGNYSFKKLFNYKKIIQQNIHSKKLKIIHSKKLFIFLKNWLSPRARVRSVLQLDAGESKLYCTLHQTRWQINTMFEYKLINTNANANTNQN